MDYKSSPLTNSSCNNLTKLTIYDWLVALTGFMIALIVYWITLTPSLSYLSPDGSELATIPYILGLAHSPGYPFYTFMGFIFSHILPFGDVAHRMNLMSAILGALGVGGLYLIIYQLLPNTLNRFLTRSIAWMSALLFAFSADFWSQALIAEVYAPNIGMIALTILALLWWENTRHYLSFFVFALSFGLSLGTHLSDLGFAPSFLLFINLTIVLTNKISRKKKIKTDRSDEVETLDLQKNAQPKNDEDSSRTEKENSPNKEAKQEKPILAKIREFFWIAVSGITGFVIGILQFAWLPLRASTLNDRNMLRSTPTSLHGIYKYTLGAFPNFKFAFPINVLPLRITQYLNFVRLQYSLFGLILGFLGLLFLLFKRPRHYFLLVGMYLVHIWFFIQYNVFDLEVFYIPAHFFWAVFMSFGVWGLFWGIQSIFNFNKKDILRLAAYPLGIILLLVPIIPLSKNFSDKNYSGDTAINDFYSNVWEYLPENSAFLTSSGVFGYDAFYWQFVYETRTDVFLPMLPGPNSSPSLLADRELYANVSSVQNNRGPGAVPADLINQNSWTVPVLIGEQPTGFHRQRTPLILYHITNTPPELVVDNINPDFEFNENVGGINLLGMDISTSLIESGDSFDITFYWVFESVLFASRPRVETALNGIALEQHEIGFGLFQRYAREIGISPGDIVQEKYTLVIPSDTEEGFQQFSIHLANIEGKTGPDISLTNLEIKNEESTFERWLNIAKGIHKE